jgi:hypothetical protein
MMVGPNGMVGHYYQATNSMSHYGPQISEVRYEKMEEPFPSYQTAVDLVSMPQGAGHHELLMLQPQQHMQPTYQEGMLDPRLEQHDASRHVLYYDEPIQQQQEMPTNGGYEQVSQWEMSYQPEAYHPGLTTLTEEHDVWGDGPAGSDFESALQKLT